MTDEIDILVSLLDEGTDVYIQAKCRKISNGKFQIISISDSFGGITEFKVGDKVLLVAKSN